MANSKKKTIFTDQFLLESKMANKLYHNHVANLPIIDYHNHLPPNEIAENKKFKKRTVQYVRFPGGPPPEYWTRPWLLSFGDRTGSGVSNQV